MKIRTFKHGYKNGWEVDFFFGKLNIRIARHQFAIWRNYNPIIDLLF